MDEKDLWRLEGMMARVLGQFRGEIDQSIDLRFNRFQGEIGEDFRHQLSIQREDFQHKLDLVVEGQHSLVEGMTRLEGRMERLDNRVDGIAVDLSAHRRDTEAHRKGWRVREEEGGE
ncbi:hypothetical protein [Desulfuromonas sp. TF]|uniref:hypothetical protein n=1 Tax=Desulfuromonas sp. TF TaxID=1232410 RepID=UPI0003F9F785|nr:hypothetical protein [Desulfuromonas sp. TF]